MKEEAKHRVIEFNGETFSCTTSIAMSLIGGKWKSVILVYLLHGKKRYSELKKLMPFTTERTLSLQLKQLEKDGLIKRKVYSKKPPLRVEYELTDFGQSVGPVLQAVAEWGMTVAEKKGEIVEEG